MELINFKFFVENDSNPFILFTNLGKIKYLNTSAEVLMGSTSQKALYDIALTHAPQTFGSKKSALNLIFSSFEFYGINVLYENDEYIAIYLYTKPLEQTNKEMILDGFSLTDINMLIQANIELFNMNYEGKLRLLTDYDIPEFQIHQNNFSLLLRNLLSKFNESKQVEINVKIKLGEQVIIKEKKYSIIVLSLKSMDIKHKDDQELKDLAHKNCINIQLEKHTISLEIPAIS